MKEEPTSLQSSDSEFLSEELTPEYLAEYARSKLPAEIRDQIVFMKDIEQFKADHFPHAGPTRDPSHLVEIDGSKFQGGGYLVRCALSLAVLFLQQTKIYRIRALEEKSGVSHQI